MKTNPISTFSFSHDQNRIRQVRSTTASGVTRECLEDAPEISYRGQNVSRYISNFSQDWIEMNLKELQHSRDNNVLGYSDMIMANRLSCGYDLRGPRLVIFVSS
jgi:hypothetical protein